MKVTLLTTDTTHHAYFARKLGERFPWQSVVLERWRPTAPFDTAHAFEAQRDEYERQVLLEGRSASWREVGAVVDCDRVTDPAIVGELERVRPDVIVVFGTGRVTGAVQNAATLTCLNLHGGNPEEYRGLDSHLWAIYHRDFRNLVTTLHRIDDGLDTGDIVDQAALDIPTGTGLHELRAINTKACVALVLGALERIDRTGSLEARKQERRGRYYSHMPSCLKEECLIKFRRFTASQ